MSDYSNLIVLVTGGSGFIGQHLCRRLLDEHNEVHATSRTERAQRGNGPIWWQVDMADLAAARRLVKAIRPDIVYHLAGTVGASPGLELVLPAYQTLLTSTINVLMVATECGCARVVLTGSFTSPLPGSVEPTPQSPYGAAKWAACGYGRMFYSLYRTPVTILSPFMTYGPGQATTKLIPSVMLALLRGGSPQLTNCNVRFDWVYITDVIEAFTAAATTPGIEGRTIELGSGSLVSARYVINRIVDIVGGEGRPAFGALPDRPGENVIAANTQVARELLGWRATTPLYDGLRQTMEWYRARLEEAGQFVSNFEL